MKKIFTSIISFIIILTITFTGIAPTSALALESISSQTNQSDSNIPIGERYHVIENGYRGKYDLQEGIFGYQSIKQENKSSVYFYSDGYFEDSPEIYNPSLSSMSLALALAGFNAQRTEFDENLPSGLYSNLCRHVKVLMSDIGIKEDNIYINEDFTTRPTEDSIGMIMGAKEISIDNEEFILVPIAVRGGDYESEWASNCSLGTSGEALGFSNSADKVVANVTSYLNTNTSFDFTEALNSGKVKFWIVGYSRGGAVANITSKRLTETYGEMGNSVYGYCFEAPAGGVDSAEINQPWTYGGIYSNIHNIINTSDIVPLVPTKEMGFKRYGVDHYIPGTDAGEIITTTYTTATGITVTTHADNSPLEVGSDAYNERREDMVESLAIIAPHLEFKDSFSLATINVLNIVSGGEIITTLESDITTSVWLNAFVSDLQSWAANGTYTYGRLDGGGYGNDFRKFYTTHTKFAGKNHVTLETALKYILKLAFTNYENQEFLEALSYRALSFDLEYSNILDLYLNLIQKWSTLSTSKQNGYIEKFWNIFNGDMSYEDGTPVKKISDFVEGDEKELLEHSFYTLFSFLFLFTTKDHNTAPQLNDINTKGLHLVSLIYNIMTVAEGHCSEVCMSWLRTYDENYSIENAKFVNSTVELINEDSNYIPSIKYQIDVQTENNVISLSAIINSNSGVDAKSTNNGSTIYYAFFDGDQQATDWQIYTSPIVLNRAENNGYSLKAFTVRFEQTSIEFELTNEELYTETVIVEPPQDEDGENTDNTTPDNTTNNTNENITSPANNNNIVIIIASAVAGVVVIGIVIAIIVKRKKK